jgi:hypothetical protein
MFVFEPFLSPDGDGGGAPKGDGEPAGNEGKPEVKPPKQDPKPDTITMTVDDFNARIDRAKQSWERDLETKRAEVQGEFKTIVETEYKPLKARVENELTPEIDRWRRLANQEIELLKKDVPEELIDLMPENIPLFDQIDWLRKAKDRAAKLKIVDAASKPPDKPNGNNPLDDPKRKNDEKRDEVLGRVRDQLINTTRYAT